MYNERFQRSLSRRLPQLEADYGIVPMGSGAIVGDAQPALTTTPNAGVPAWFTYFVDPDVLKILFARNKAARILGGDGVGERKVGDWVTTTALFPVVEATGNTSAYGDYSENGVAGVNTTFPQRQSFHYQNIIEYGEREVEMIAKAKIDLVAEKKEASTVTLNKFGNQTYFFGVNGLQNYGLINDPALPASLTPGTKAYGGMAWIVNGVIKATPNEILLDIQSLFSQLVAQSDGLVELDMESPMVLAMSPASQVALTSANSFNVDVFDLLKKNWPNLRLETAVQYATGSGNLVQLIAETVEGQRSGFCAFTEKLRAHTIVRGLSSWRQKISQGTWGAINRQPFAYASMLGV